MILAVKNLECGHHASVVPVCYDAQLLELMSSFIEISKPLMREVTTARRHLLAEKRAIHGTWYT